MSESVETLIDRYCSVWNESDGLQRLVSLKTIFVEEGVYMDPSARAVGPDELNNHISLVCRRYPNSTIVRTSPIDLHHNVARFAWKKVLADGTPLPEGLDVVEISEGKICKIWGFFGPLPDSEARNAVPSVCSHDQVLRTQKDYAII